MEPRLAPLCSAIFGNAFSMPMRALFVLGTFLAGSCEAFYTPGAVSRAVVTRASAIECHLRPRAVSYDPEFGDNTIARRQMLSSTANTPGPATRAGGSTSFSPQFGDNTVARRQQLSAYGNTPGPAAREEMTRDGSPTTFNPQFGDNTISRRKQLSAYGNTPGPATRAGGSTTFNPQFGDNTHERRMSLRFPRA